MAVAVAGWFSQMCDGWFKLDTTIPDTMQIGSHGLFTGYDPLNQGNIVPMILMDMFSMVWR